MINAWEDLREIFTSHLQGTYVRPGNRWDLKSCRQNRVNPSLITFGASPESAMLLKVADTDVISAFWSNTTCRTLVHELSRD
jgi:hypothetical protein